MSGGIVFDAYALAFGLTLGGVVGLFYALRAKHRGRRKPWDWQVDGECDNHNVRILP